MKKKNIKDQKLPTGKKTPHNPSQFIPQPSLSNLHSTTPLQCQPSQNNENTTYSPFAEPFTIPDEWIPPSDIESFNKSLLENPSTPYEDPDHSKLISHLPLTFIKKEHNELMWLRPYDYITNANIDKEIKRLYPKKRYIQMREDIKIVYQEELKQYEDNSDEDEDEHHNLDDYIKEDSITLKRNIYKDFYKYLETPPEINVIRFTERDETDDEYHQRVDTIIENQKNELAKFKMIKFTKNNPKEKRPMPPIVQRPEDFPRIRISEEDPSNIDVKHLITNTNLNNPSIALTGTSKHPSQNISNELNANSFLTWLSSIYQFILDLEIKDCVNNVNVFSNIYPQRNGVPIYNPNGHYVIKLYFMGKPRKIEIDDRMPCSKEGEFIFPRCEHLNEIWPHLFTKALLKLNLYKVKHPFYTKFEENVDTSYIYAITGYHAEIIENFKNEQFIIDTLNMNLSDDAVVNKKKYILCLNLIKPTYKENEELYYDEIMDRIEKEKKGEQMELIFEEGKSISSNSKSVDPHRNLRRRQSVTKSGSTLYKHLSSLTEGYFRGGSNDNGNVGKFTRTYRREKTSVVQHFSVLDSKLKVISNYAYSINDFFSNDSFNMNRLKPLDFADLKQALKDNTVVFKQLNKEEKKEYIKQRKELKAKQLEIKNKRIDELTNEGKKFLIIKIKNNSIGQYKLNSILNYTEEQILMAKKCLLNNWKYPPPSFFESYFIKYDYDNDTHLPNEQQQQQVIHNETNNDDVNKVQYMNDNINVLNNNNNNNQIGVISEYEELNRKEFTKVVMKIPRKQNNDEVVHKKKPGAFDWTRQSYIQLIGNDNLHIYIDNEDNHIKQPIPKPSGGNWMNFGDFKSLFNTFLILHNPISIFKGGSLSIDNNWHSYHLDIYEPLEDFTVFKLTTSSSSINDDEAQTQTQAQSIDNCSALLIFEPNNDTTLICRDKIYSYIILDIYDNEHTLIEGDICLNRFYSTYHFKGLNSNKDYYIVLRGGIYQFGFYLQIFSEVHQLENMSYINYMTTVFGYQYTQFKVEHPRIETNTYYLLSRFKLETATNEEGLPIVNEDELGDVKVVIQLKYPLKYVKPFIDVLIYKDNNIHNKGKKIFIGEEITLTQGKYYIVVAFNKCNYELKENALDVDIIFSNKNYKVEQIENVDYYQLTNDYINNRHNIVFKELIYAGEKIYASLDIELVLKKLEQSNNVTNVPTTIPTKEEESIISDTNSNNNNTTLNKDNSNNSNYNKIKLIFELYQLVDSSNEDVPLIDKKFSYGLRGKLIKSYEGFNCLTIPHMCFEGSLLSNDEPKRKIIGKPSMNIPIIDTPPIQTYPYLFICYIDHDVNITKYLSQYKLSWVIRVFPSNTLSFVKDTSKEEHEKKLKNSWEENEPGRSLKAANSRKRFILEERKNTGIQLTEEENKFLLTARERRVSTFYTGDNNNNNDNHSNIRASNRKSVSTNKFNVSSKKALTPFTLGNDNDNVNNTNNTTNNVGIINLLHKDLSTLNINKKLPKTKEHCSYYVKHYLNYAYKKRTIKIDTILDQYHKVINTEQLKTEKNENIQNEVDEFEKTTRTEMSNTFYNQDINNTETLNNLYKTQCGFRMNKYNSMRNLLKRRNDLKDKFQSKITCQQNLQDAIINHNVNGYTIEQMVMVYKDGVGLLGKDHTLVSRLFAVISAKKEESIKNDIKKFTPKDKGNVIKIIEDIEFNQWDVSLETKAKLKELVK